MAKFSEDGKTIVDSSASYSVRGVRSQNRRSKSDALQWARGGQLLTRVQRYAPNASHVLAKAFLRNGYRVYGCLT